MNTKSDFIERYSLPTFLILTPLLSLAIPLFLELPTELVPLIMIFIPALMAILLTSLSKGRKGVVALLQKLIQWRIPFKWFAISLGSFVKKILPRRLLHQAAYRILWKTY